MYVTIRLLVDSEHKQKPLAHKIRCLIEHGSIKDAFDAVEIDILKVLEVEADMLDPTQK